MTTAQSWMGETTTKQAYDRFIGRHRTDAAGPTVVCVAGLHGNEPAGLLAMRRVFAELKSREFEFRGEFVGLAGNLAALERGVRFVDEDLNRIWDRQRVREMHFPVADSPATVEAAQMRELAEALDSIFADARGEVYFLDLHTSSADGEPFVLLGDTLRNRAFALQFPVPVILGLEEQIDGTALEYVNSLGHVTLGFEAGQHEAHASVDDSEAAVWVALAAAGCVERSEVSVAQDRLRRRAARLPQVLEIRHRHAIAPGDGFQMLPGFVNFQTISAGQRLADDASGPITADFDSRILLPLYQGLGDDGFFLARDVRPFWLSVSAMLRRIRAHACVGLLPGVSKHPSEPMTYLVDRRVARWFVMEFFHLLGFRKKRIFGEHLIVSRRMFDLRGPGRLT